MASNYHRLELLAIVLLLLHSNIEEGYAESVSVVTKDLKGQILLLIRNYGNTPIYKIELNAQEKISLEIIRSDNWHIENYAYDTVILSGKPLVKGQSIILSTTNTELEWRVYSSHKEISSGIVSKDLYSEDNSNYNASSSNYERYPVPVSDNGNSLTQLGYLWNKDPILVNIIVQKDKDQDIANLVIDAINEWQYKLRKASGNESAWNFDIKVLDLKKDPVLKADVTIMIRNSLPIDPLPDEGWVRGVRISDITHIFTIFNLKKYNFVEYFGGFNCVTDQGIEYDSIYKEYGKLFPDLESSSVELAARSEMYGLGRENYFNLDRLLFLYKRFHEIYEHGTIDSCVINLEPYFTTILAYMDGSNTVKPVRDIPAETLRSVAKKMIGHILGLGYTSEEPQSLRNADLMSYWNQMIHQGWRPNLGIEYYVSQQDIDAILKLYGNDGFSGINNEKHPLNDTCLNSHLSTILCLPDYIKTAELKLEMSLKDRIVAGEMQRIELKVTSDNLPINDVYANCIITDSQNRKIESFKLAYILDNGIERLTWISDPETRPGIYTAKCMAVKEPYYDPFIRDKIYYYDAFASMEFEVTPS